MRADAADSRSEDLVDLAVRQEQAPFSVGERQMLAGEVDPEARLSGGAADAIAPVRVSAVAASLDQGGDASCELVEDVRLEVGHADSFLEWRTS